MADDLHSPEPWPSGRVLVQAATYDERENIGPLIDAVLALDPTWQMLVVDDDSPDGTGRLALERAADEPRLHVLVRRGRRGLGTATLEGFTLARRRGFEVVANLDADFSHDPADLPRLVAALGPPGPGAASVAIGSRRVAGGRVVGWPLSRHVVSRLVGWFTWWILRVPVRDPSGAFRAIRLDVLDRLGRIRAEGYAFQEEFLWQVHRGGGRMVEVPITFTDRTRGASKACFAETCRSSGDLLLLARRTWLGW
jgi:dolichol-phosphate mannosyltransferase